MDKNQELFNGYFKAQDKFICAPFGNDEPSVIYDYLHWSRRMNDHLTIGGESENILLCELFLRQTYFHFIEMILDQSVNMTFRHHCLDTVHVPLTELKHFYQYFEHGHSKYLALKVHLQHVKASMKSDS